MQDRTEPDEGTFASKLTEAELGDLRTRGRRRRFPRAASLFIEGDRSDHVFLVTEGRIKISSITEDGREVVLAIREPGDLLGELSALDGHPRSANAAALDETVGFVVTADAFRSFLEDHPRLALLMLEMMSLRLRDADRKRIEFGAQDTTGRVARRLVELARRFGEESAAGTRIALPLTQQELAAWIGSSREAVSKSLQTLRQRGWIETHRRAITVVDIDALAERGR